MTITRDIQTRRHHRGSPDARIGLERLAKFAASSGGLPATRSSRNFTSTKRSLSGGFKENEVYIMAVADCTYGSNSELLRVAYCEGARYVTCMIIPVFPIM